MADAVTTPATTVGEPCVVVGCDGSAASDAALRFAAREASLHAVRLVIVAAYDRPIDPDSGTFDIPDTELAARARARTEHVLRRAFSTSDVHLPKHAIVTAEGDPAQVLLDHAANAVMIVIGWHDRSMLQRLFGHLTSRHLLYGSAVPVTIVPTLG